MQFLILVYLLVFDTILAAPFWMHSNLCRLDLERPLKCELIQPSNQLTNQPTNRQLTRALATSTEAS